MLECVELAILCCYLLTLGLTVGLAALSEWGASVACFLVCCACAMAAAEITGRAAVAR